MGKIAGFLTSTNPVAADIGLFMLRLGFGGMLLLGHGWGKLSAKPDSFADPLGIGSTMSYYGAVGAEVVCAGLIVIGLITRVAALPALFTMLVAAFAFHGGDPLFTPRGGGSAKEPALTYALAFFAILCLGPGRLSLDHIIFGGGKK